MTAPAKTLVILQSNYLPWKGYFDLMAAADEFIIYDEVQFTKNDWRNRNRIILNGKPHWLTIPVKTSGTLGQAIELTEVSVQNWSRIHLETIQQAYRRAAFYKVIFPVLEAAYAEVTQKERLSIINELFLKTLAGQLGIEVSLLRSSSIPRTKTDPTERLIEILTARKATHYISGPAAKAYLDQSHFEKAGIRLSFANYAGYPSYDQASDHFEHGVSVVDLLMRCGPTASRQHLKAFHDRDGFLNGN
jgi:WbqC-like protein family